MTTKLILLYYFSRETRTGMIRMRETRGESILSLLRGFKGIVRLMGRSKGTLFAITISTLVSIVGMINTTFWQIIVNQKIGVPDTLLPFFPMLRSILAMVFFFTIIPHLTGVHLRKPLLLGFSGYLIGQTILILTPPVGGLGYASLCLSLVFDGFGVAMLAMLAESLVALHVDAAERARVLALLQMTVMFVSAPFGWIGGFLSGISRNLPFVMNIIILGIGILVTLLYYRGGIVTRRDNAGID
jgi:MFS family permease